MEPSERAIDMLATENSALRQKIKELKAENGQMENLIGQYRDGRTHDEIWDSYRMMKENAELKAENAELRDCSGRAKELMKELDDEIGTLKKRVTELKAENEEQKDIIESHKEYEVGLQKMNARWVDINATLKARVEELEARDKTLKKFAEKFKQEPIPPEFNKIIDDHFWELFA